MDGATVWFWGEVLCVGFFFFFVGFFFFLGCAPVRFNLYFCRGKFIWGHLANCCNLGRSCGYTCFSERASEETGMLLFSSVVLQLQLVALKLQLKTRGSFLNKDIYILVLFMHENMDYLTLLLLEIPKKALCQIMLVQKWPIKLNS